MPEQHTPVLMWAARPVSWEGRVQRPMRRHASRGPAVRVSRREWGRMKREAWRRLFKEDR